MKYDLHVHSVLSDGKASRRDLISSAINNETKYLSFTDHNICAKIENFSKKINIINGIEIDCVYNEKKVHLLAYGIDNSDQINKYLEKIKKENDYICREALILLKKKYGIIISDDEILKYTNDFLTKRIIAKILMDKFSTDNVDFVYNNFIGSKSQSHISQKKLELIDTISFLKSMNLVLVLAHPITLYNQCSSVTEFETILENLYYCGLDGIEVINPKSNANFSEYLDNNYSFKKFIKTAGTDYHGYAKNYDSIDHDDDKYLYPLLKVLKKNEKIR